jgi:hypothetical protein
MFSEYSFNLVEFNHSKNKQVAMTASVELTASMNQAFRPPRRISKVGNDRSVSQVGTDRNREGSYG